MNAVTAPDDVSLDFLKIWHHVFARNLEYGVTRSAARLELSEATVSDDTLCQAGRWLATLDPVLRERPMCREFINVHRHFHQIAGRVVGLQQAHRNDEATALLDREFREASEAVCAAIDLLAAELDDLGVRHQRSSRPWHQGANTLWSPTLEIGIPDLDRQHHGIAVLIDQLIINGDVTANTTAASEFLRVLAKLIQRDVQFENRYLNDLELQDLDCSDHLAAHRDVISYLTDLNGKLDRNEPISFAEVGRFLSNWYVDHLVTFDLELENTTAEH